MLIIQKQFTQTTFKQTQYVSPSNKKEQNIVERNPNINLSNGKLDDLSIIQLYPFNLSSLSHKKMTEEEKIMGYIKAGYLNFALEKILDSDHKDKDGLIQKLAQSAISEKQLDQAFDYAKYIKSTLKRKPVLESLAIKHARMKNYNKAIQCAKTIIHPHSNSKFNSDTVQSFFQIINIAINENNNYDVAFKIADMTQGFHRDILLGSIALFAGKKGDILKFNEAFSKMNNSNEKNDIIIEIIQSLPAQKIELSKHFASKYFGETDILDKLINSKQSELDQQAQQILHKALSKIGLNPSNEYTNKFLYQLFNNLKDATIENKSDFRNLLTSIRNSKSPTYIQLSKKIEAYIKKQEKNEKEMKPFNDLTTFYDALLELVN